MPYDTHRTLLKLPEFAFGNLGYGPVYIPTYLVTFLLAIFIVSYFALRKGNKQMFNLLALSGLFGLAGARLFYVAIYQDLGFVDSIFYYFNFSRSGLASAGGAMGIAAAILAYGYFHKKEIWNMLDQASTAMMPAFAVGRVGCFLAGCCYGSEASVPWAIFYREAARHPAQLYDIINALSVFFIVRKIKHTKEGSRFLWTIVLYSAFRVIVEMFRVGPGIGPISYNQMFYAALAIASFAVLKLR